MRNKRGQFYIVAAILLVLIIGTLVSVKTYSFVKSQPHSLQEASLDLKEESSRILDYGIYNQVNLSSLLTNFTSNDFRDYFLRKTDYTNLTIIYGNEKNLYQVEYVKDNNAGAITFDNARFEIKHTRIQSSDITSKISSNSEGEKIVTTKVLKKDYEFKLRENEMFYFVIGQEKNGEVFIEKN